MLTKEQTEEIFHALQGLPAEKMVEVKDFILFLKQRYGMVADSYRDDWDEEDIADLMKASMKHADNNYAD